MRSFKEFISELWDTPAGQWNGSYMGHKVGAHVMVHKPGDANHGKPGRIIRQQTTEYGVEMPHAPGKLHWYNASHLKPHQN